MTWKTILNNLHSFSTGLIDIHGKNRLYWVCDRYYIHIIWRGFTINNNLVIPVFLTFTITACLFSILMALIWRSARHGTVIAANVLRYTRNAVLTVDLHERVTAANDAFQEVTGKKLPEVLGKRYSDVFGHISPLAEGGAAFG